MKAINLARVSTEEQKEAGNSLPAQQARLRSYVDRNPKLRLDKEFIFDESAYKEHRKEFQKVIDYVLSQKEIVALCCDKVDRLTRDFLVGLPELEKLRREGRIELHFPSDNLVLHQNSPATDLFHFNIAVSLAQYYSNAISDNVKRSFEQKRRNGEWVGKAPMGYQNIKNDKGNKDIIPDPATAHLIRKMFELYASGNHSTKTVRKAIAREGLKASSGLPLAISMVDHILNNPFYYGQMLCKGQIYPHKYQPIIAKDIFDKCQTIRKGWKKKPFQYAAKPYIFRGLLRCARCGCAMSPETAKGKFIYYSCTNAKKELCDVKVYVPEKDLLKPIYGYLQALSAISQDRIDEIVAGLKRTSQAQGLYHKKAIDGLQQEYNATQVRIDRLLELLLDGSITKPDYDKKLKSLKEKQYDLGIRLEDHTKADENYHITAATVLSLAKSALEIFESSEIEEKRSLLNYLLQNSTVDGKTPHYSLREPFNTLLKMNNFVSKLRR